MWLQQYMKQAFLLLFLVACATGHMTTEPTIKIGGLFALTGGGESWGADELKSVQLAIEEANAEGGNFLLIPEDTHTTQTVAVTAATKLITLDNVAAIIGPTWDEDTAAVAPLAQRHGKVMISPSISEGVEATVNYPYLFSTWYSDISAVQKISSFVTSQGHDNIAVVYNLNTWATFQKDLFEKETAEELEIFAASNQVQDFRTILLKIKEQADAVYVAFTSDETLLPFMKQAQELGLDIPLFLGHQTESETMLEWQLAYQGGVYHPYPKETEAHKGFVERFTKKHGQPPTGPSAAPAYDAAKLIITGLQQDQPLQEWLTTADIEGVTVPQLRFTSKGMIAAGPEAFDVRKATSEGFATVG